MPSPDKGGIQKHIRLFFLFFGAARRPHAALARVGVGAWICDIGHCWVTEEPGGAAVQPLLTSANLVRLDAHTVRLTIPQRANYDIITPETSPSATSSANCGWALLDAVRPPIKNPSVSRDRSSMICGTC